MIVSVPLSALGEEPVTGASRNAWPRWRAPRRSGARRRRDRRHVDEQRPIRRAGNRAVLAEQDRLDLGAVDDHRDDDVGARCGVGRRGGSAGALVFVGPRLRLAGGPRPCRHRKALALQVRGHPRAHDAQSQEADVRHGGDPSARWPGPGDPFEVWVAWSRCSRGTWKGVRSQEGERSPSRRGRRGGAHRAGSGADRGGPRAEGRAAAGRVRRPARMASSSRTAARGWLRRESMDSILRLRRPATSGGRCDLSGLTPYSAAVTPYPGG